MNVLDLFSGIGGFSLGLERAGMRTVAFCEIDRFCRRVLAKHWPGVPVHDDITTREFREGEADIISGGFPCQDISDAGQRAGITGERSGLWRELLRAIRLVRPRYAIVENVAALLGRGMGTVLGDLAEIGHDAEWHCIPAFAVGAPHRRDRVWIITADAARGGHGRDGLGEALRGQLDHPGDDMADANGGRRAARQPTAAAVGHGHSTCPESGDVPDAELAGSQGLRAEHKLRQQSDGVQAAGRSWWSVEPNVGRVAHGVPARVDRLRGLGNAVVPQIPEIIGRAIMREANP